MGQNNPAPFRALLLFIPGKSHVLFVLQSLFYMIFHVFGRAHLFSCEAECNFQKQLRGLWCEVW